MWKQVRTEFKVIIQNVEDEDYNSKIQKCMELLLEKVVKK